MNRRKLLAGFSSLVGAGGLALGTGAFSFSQTDRELTVEVTNDRRGYLVLDPLAPLHRSDFNDDDGLIRFSITGSQADADGVNPNAVTRFDGESGSDNGLLQVGNEGSETVDVFTRASTVDDNLPEALFFDVDDGVLLDGENQGRKTLEPGEYFNAGLWIDTRGVTPREESYTVPITIVGESEPN